MRARCSSPKANNYHLYGARGITVCKRWMSFKNFLEDMGERPTRQHSIDRIDNNGNYEPSNCRWATKAMQANNRRTNRKITWNGVTKNATEWAKDLGIRQKTLFHRMDRGNSLEKVFSKKTIKPLIHISFNGKTQTLNEWGKEIGIKPHTIHARLTDYGWSVERALTVKLKKKL